MNSRRKTFNSEIRNRGEKIKEDTKKKKRKKKRYKTSKDSGKKEKVKRRTRFRSEKGGWVRDERRWWTIHGLHPASRLGAPPPPVSSPVLLHLRARFSTSPSPSRPTFYPVLLVSARSLHHPPNPGTHLSTLGPFVRFLSRSSPPGGVSLVTSSSSTADHATIRASKKRERVRGAGILLLFALDRIPFTRQGVSWSPDRKSLPLRWKRIPRHLRPARSARSRAFIGSLIAGNSNSQTVRCPGWFFYGALNDPDPWEISPSLFLLYVYFSLFLSQWFSKLYFIIIYWPDGNSSSFYIKTYKEDGGELKSYFLINFNDIEICD